MKKFSPLFLLLFSLHTQAQQDFSKYKWRNRILLISAPSLSDDAFKAQYSSLMGSQKKLEDRNLIIFTLVKGRIYDKDLKPIQHFDVAALRKAYGINATYTGVLLIGKDGGSKFKKPFQVEPKVIFETIDQMPMRQKEMRENIED